MKLHGFGKTAAVLLTTGAVLGLGTGVACAATPQVAHSATVTTAANDSLGKTSIGIWLYNNSSDNLVLQSVTGDNAGVPTVGSDLSSGVGHQDFEVVFRAAKTTTVTATYQVQDETGADLGTATVQFWDNAVGMSGASGSFRATDGTSLPLKTEYIGSTGNYEVVDSTAVTHTVDAATSQAGDLVQRYCNDANNSAVCTFKPTSKTPTSTTVEKLLVSGYTPSDSKSPSVISVSAGYDDQTSTTVGGAVSASMKLGKVLSAGVSQAYSQTLAFDQTFTASESYQVDPGYTGYIWGYVPVLEYTGTLTIQVGNTTWDITNFTVTSPDSTRSLSDFHPQSYLGDYPIGTPDQPPAA